MPEARVEKMENRVFRAADVEIDGEPLLEKLGVRKALVVGRVDVAEIVPAGPGPLRHRVRLADALLAGLRVDDVHPLGRLCKRRLAGAGRLVVGKLGERERQVFLGNERVRAVLPVDHRERLAPVALAREEPVAELVLRLRLAYALFLKPRNHLLARVIHRKPGDEARRHHDASRNVGESRLAHVRHGVGRCVLRGLAVGGRNYLHDREVKDLGKVEVTLVVSGNGHDCARSIARKHVVGNEDRELIAVHRIDANDTV